MKRKLLKRISILLAVLVIIGAIGGLFYYLYTKYEISTVYVEGNTHYTDDEIRDIVQTGRLGNNSLYLSYKYRNKAVKDIPFVERMDVSVLSPDTIKITVYEKALAGYIDYLGKYVYFDKDGIVTEVSTVKTEGIPEVIGVEFDYVVLHEQLPTENKELFRSVLNMTQLMTKYGVDAQKMYFKDNGDIVLYKDSIIIKLGGEENLDIKVMNLPALLDNLEGLSGTLRMEHYDEGTKKITFEKDE